MKDRTVMSDPRYTEGNQRVYYAGFETGAGNLNLFEGPTSLGYLIEQVVPPEGKEGRPVLLRRNKKGEYSTQYEWKTGAWVRCAAIANAVRTPVLDVLSKELAERIVTHLNLRYKRLNCTFEFDGSVVYARNADAKRSLQVVTQTTIDKVQFYCSGVMDHVRGAV